VATTNACGMICSYSPGIILYVIVMSYDFLDVGMRFMSQHVFGYPLGCSP
jgi:hypothetical protein